jgi:hypothetical protein
MTFIIGTDFRMRSGFVTDQPNCYPETSQFTSNYPSSEGGTTDGYTVGSTAVPDASSSVDPRIAGFAYDSSGREVYRIDVRGVEAYIVNLGVGDARNAFDHPTTVSFYDSHNCTRLIQITTGFRRGVSLTRRCGLWQRCSVGGSQYCCRWRCWWGSDKDHHNKTGMTALFFHWDTGSFIADGNIWVCHSMIQAVPTGPPLPFMESLV